MIRPIVLSSAMRSNLLTLQRTQSVIDEVTLRLATSLKVSSALDNPQNFFTARSLDYRASDLARRLEGIGQSIRTIEAASSGVEAIERLLNQSEAIAKSRLEELIANGEIEPTETVSLVDPLSTQILALNPDAYWRLNDTSANTAVNLGAGGAAINGFYQNSPSLGSSALYEDGDVSVGFNGTTQYINIPNSNLINVGTQTHRTVELVFNANDTSGRQVLYEEGGTTNAFSIYIDNGSVYVNGRDAGDWGPVNISASIDAGTTYHVAFTFNSTTNQFIGYLNGEVMGTAVTANVFPSHTAGIGIGRMNDASWFHDGAQNGNGFYFNGRISDVALYNVALDETELANHAASVTDTTEKVELEDDDFNDLMQQITDIASDAQYRGIALLNSDNLTTIFNESGSSKLMSEGVDLTAEGLGIQTSSFASITDIEAILEDIRAARNEVRAYGRTLATDYSILQTRETFTRQTINTLTAGADDLTNADMNEEGANLLALQTRQQIGVTALSLAAQSANSTINLFA